MLELRLPMERGFHRRRARWKRDERKKTDGEKKEERDEKKLQVIYSSRGGPSNGSGAGFMGRPLPTRFYRLSITPE